MAPFKLKFRMGSSRSSSQETTNTEQSEQLSPQPLNNQPNQSITASNTTIDSEFNNLGLNNDQRILLSNRDERTGLSNPILAEPNSSVPLSPPPSYEYVLKENRLANRDKDNNLTTSLAKPLNNCKSQNCLNDTNYQLNNIVDPVGILTYPTPMMSNTTVTMQSSREDLINETGSSDPLFGTSNQFETQTSLDDIHIIAQTGNVCDERSSESEIDDSSGDEWNLNENQQYDNNSQQISDTIINNKSSKEIYKAVAKKWGITCKMSEQCRCMECQSNYFDCDDDQNENQKSDGGLGAGTPMFISEVIHGSACTIL